MIKIYRKTATIQAEQFDGSDEMVRRYGLVDRGGHIVDGLHVDNACFIWTNEGHLKINYHDWIATGINGEHWPISDEVFKKTYVELPVIPDYVASYIKYKKSKENSLLFAFIDSEYVISGEWISNHAESFARAWLDGYQVKEDKDD